MDCLGVSFNTYLVTNYLSKYNWSMLGLRFFIRTENDFSVALLYEHLKIPYLPESADLCSAGVDSPEMTIVTKTKNTARYILNVICFHANVSPWSVYNGYQSACGVVNVSKFILYDPSPSCLTIFSRLMDMEPPTFWYNQRLPTISELPNEKHLDTSVI